MEPERELEPAPGPERAAPLPFLEDELWVYTAAFLDDARALGRLARVARRFPAVAEQAATLALARRPQHVRDWVPAELLDGSDDCRLSLSRLYEADTLLQPHGFEAHGPAVQLADDSCVATSSGIFQAATCGALMRAGTHAASFTLISRAGDIDTSAGNEIGCWVGVVGEEFDAAVGLPAMNAGGRSAMLYTLSCPQLFGTATEGDVVGLELSFQTGELQVLLNGTSCGTLVESELRGPLRWACDVGYGGAVRVDLCQPSVVVPEGIVPERAARPD